MAFYYRNGKPYGLSPGDGESFVNTFILIGLVLMVIVLMLLL